MKTCSIISTFQVPHSNTTFDEVVTTTSRNTLFFPIYQTFAGKTLLAFFFFFFTCIWNYSFNNPESDVSLQTGWIFFFTLCVSNFFFLIKSLLEEIINSILWSPMSVLYYIAQWLWTLLVTFFNFFLGGEEVRKITDNAPVTNLRQKL